MSKQSCTSCGGTDHQRKNSKKCRNYAGESKAVLKVKVEKEISLQKSSFYTVVCGLEKFVNPDAAVILKVIESDVVAVSKTMFEFSIYCNYYFRRKSHEDPVYFETLRDTPIRVLLYQIQGKENFSRGDAIYADYINIRRPLVNSVQSSRYRSIIYQEQIKLFETCLKNNITINIFKRLVAYFSKVPARPGQSPLTKQFAKIYVRGLMGSNDVDPRLEIGLGNLEKNPYHYIPMLYRVQQAMTAANQKSFPVVPVFKAKMHHVQITNSALFELINSCVEQFPGQLAGIPDKINKRQLNQNLRFYWESLFNVHLFENAQRQFHNISTDGIRVSVHMKKSIPKESLPSKSDYKPEDFRFDHKMRLLNTSDSRPFPNFDFVIGVDPGYRLILGAVKFEVATGKREEIKGSSKSLHYQSGLFARKKDYRT